MILYNSSIIYAEFMIDNLENKLSEIFKELEIDIFKNDISVTLLAGDIELPTINININL